LTSYRGPLTTLVDKAIAGCTGDEVEEIRSLGKTLSSWRTEVIAHHRTGASNGPTEGLNLSSRRNSLARTGNGAATASSRSPLRRVGPVDVEVVDVLAWPSRLATVRLEAAMADLGIRRPRRVTPLERAQRKSWAGGTLPHRLSGSEDAELSGARTAELEQRRHLPAPASPYRAISASGDPQRESHLPRWPDLSREQDRLVPIVD
jgi:hypothetical protein